MSNDFEKYLHKKGAKNRFLSMKGFLIRKQFSVVKKLSNFFFKT